MPQEPQRESLFPLIVLIVGVLFWVGFGAWFVWQLMK
jgi:hypothetical protein